MINGNATKNCSLVDLYKFWLRKTRFKNEMCHLIVVQGNFALVTCYCLLIDEESLNYHLFYQSNLFKSLQGKRLNTKSQINTRPTGSIFGISF